MIKQVKCLAIVSLIVCYSCNDTVKPKPIQDEAKETDTALFQEAYRPQFHFSPPSHWMNDPNGLVFNEGIYHLFYQYYPDDVVWGPMHWGHATSKDMIRWTHKPIALYPDSLGYIFSGSAVVDKNNTSGFAKGEEKPLVAIYTYHDPVGAEKGTNTYQTQGIAYSLDNGDTWEKYANNPVIANPGEKDFRDPKVFWYDEGEYWIMSLVAGDHARFYTSNDLKNWSLMSTFGKGYGSHAGVWECPDLFKIKVDGTDDERWVLFISINPGGPNSGSATQYFVGDFDGTTFTTNQKEAKWIDHGTDNYAGMTYNNTPDGRHLFIGWMSNWNYGQKVPTKDWRSAMTLPRTLSLSKINGTYYLKSNVIQEVQSILSNKDAKINRELAVNDSTSYHLPKGGVKISFDINSKDFELQLANDKNEVVNLVANGTKNTFYIDRSKSGLIDFEKDFYDHYQLMDIKDLPNGRYNVTLYVDTASFELFMNEGQFVMTDIVFPTAPYNKLNIMNLGLERLRISNFYTENVASIWK